jgi:cleavage stimulation factor subunit 2
VNGRALRLDVAEGQSAAAMLGPNSGNNSGAGGGAGAGGGNNINNSNSGPARGATGGAGGPSSGGGNRSVNNNAGSLGAPDYMPMQLGGPTPQGSEAHISQFLEGLSQDQLWSMVANMKEQIEQTPEQARQILESNPQLAYALLQAQVLLGMVNTEQLAAAMQQLPAATAAANAASGGTAAVGGGGGAGGGSAGGAAQAPVQSGLPMPTLPDPMMQAPMYGGFGGPMQPSYGHPQMIAPEHSDLVRQVIALTPNDIAMLPPDQREQVLEIRRQLGI